MHVKNGQSLKMGLAIRPSLYYNKTTVFERAFFQCDSRIFPENKEIKGSNRRSSFLRVPGVNTA